MTGRIPAQFIEALLGHIDIVDLIKSHVPLKKTGAHHLTGLCPFHNEKTPSFSVHAARQFYHCFGCGKSGDAIQFLIELEGLSFVEAIQELAQQAGIPLPQDKTKAPTEDFGALYHVLDKANQLYQQQLRQHPDRKRVVAYLKQRGLTGVIAKQFGIGFVGDAWDTVTSTIASDQSLKKAALKTGLIIEKEKTKHCYDRFRNRIMFPIRDKRGRVVGFGGRLINEGEPKYLNSSDSPVFHKGNVLYGLFEARLTHRTLESLVVVEGYMDVVALAQAGISNVVATLGTAVTEVHIQTLFKETDALIFCFDGDGAGQKAAMRALEQSLPFMTGTRQIKFLSLPKGQDPDSFIRSQGADVFKNALKRATSLSDFLLGNLSQGINLSQMDEKVRLVALTKPFIQKLPDPVFRAVLHQRVAQWVGLDPQALAEGGKPVHKQSSTQKGGFHKRQFSPVSIVKRAVAILLKERDFLDKVDDLTGFKESTSIEARFFEALVCALRRDKKQAISTLIGHLPSEYTGLLIPQEVSAITQMMPVAGLSQEFEDAVKKLRRQVTEAEIEALLTCAQQKKLTAQQKERLAWLLAQQQTVSID